MEAACEVLTCCEAANKGVLERSEGLFTSGKGVVTVELDEDNVELKIDAKVDNNIEEEAELFEPGRD